jgi:hypothetical protein
LVSGLPPPTERSIRVLGGARRRVWQEGRAGGVVGLLIYVPWTATYYFADTIGVPLTLLVSGLVLLAGALYALRHGTSLLQAAGGDDHLR